MFGEWEGTPEDETKKTAEEKRVEAKKELLELEKEIESTTLQSLQYERERAAMFKDSFAQKEQEKKILEEVIDLENIKMLRSEDFTAEMEEQLNLKYKMIKSIKLEGEGTQEALNRLKTETSGIYKKADNQAKNFFGGIASKIGLASDMSNTLGGKFSSLVLLATKPGGLKQIKQTFKSIINPMNVAYSLTIAMAQATISMALAADKQTAAFAKATGAGQKYTDGIYELGNNHRDLGITMEDSGKAFGALYNKMPGFNKLSATAQKETALLTATLEKLGVAMEDSAQLMSDLMKAQKLTSAEARQMTMEIALAADSLQMSASKYTKGFLEANKTLAVYGSKAPKIYQKIAAAAQEAGVEAGKLLDIAGKFDTFSDAATNAGKLNAILGSQFSAMELLNMSEEKRIETLIKGMQQQGTAFKDMDRFTQKAIAATMGISDLNEAQKILGMDLSSYRKMNKEAAAAAKKQEEMDKRAKAAMDTMQNLKMAMMELAQTLKPLVTAIAKGSRWLLDIAHATRGWLGPVVGVMLALTALYKIFGPLFFLLKIAGAALLPATAAGTTVLGTAAAGAAAPVGALGVGMIGLGLGAVLMAVSLALVLYLMYEMVVALAGLGEEGVVGAASLLLVAGAVYALAGALALVGSIGLVGAVILAGFLLVMNKTIDKTTDAGKAVTGAFLQINEFLGKESSITTLGTALETLGTALGKLKTNMSGGLAGMASFLDPFNLLGGGPKSPIAQLVEDMAPLLEQADKFAIIAQAFEAMFKLGTVDLGATFSAMATGLETIYGIVSGESEKGVQITHTLENLALITTGTSAQSGGLAGVIKAISGLSTEMVAYITIDRAALEGALRGQVAQTMAQIKDEGGN